MKILKDKLVLFVFAIATVFAAYFAFVTDRLYVSKATFVVGNMNEQKQLSPNLLNLGGISNSQERDSRILINYIKSDDVLRVIERNLHISNDFKNRTDLFKSLPEKFTKREFLEFYQNNLLDATYDLQSGIITVSFSASSPELANNVINQIVSLGEKRMNAYGIELANKHLIFVENLVKLNYTKLQDSEIKLTAFQNKHLMIDPKVEIETKTGLIASLEGQLASKRAELAKSSSFMTGESFEVTSLKTDIEGIKKQISELRGSLAGNNRKRLSSDLADFERLKSEFDFNRELYKESMTQLELARVDAVKQSKIVSLLTSSGVADEKTYPNIPKMIVVTYLLACIILLIAVSFRTIIKDHVN